MLGQIETINMYAHSCFQFKLFLECLGRVWGLLNPIDGYVNVMMEDIIDPRLNNDERSDGELG